MKTVNQLWDEEPGRRLEWDAWMTRTQLEAFRAGELAMRERVAVEAPRFDGLHAADRIRAMPLSEEVPK